MPGAKGIHSDTNCTTCHGRKLMYRLGDKLFADNRKGATKIKCPACKGTGDKQGVAEGNLDPSGLLAAASMVRDYIITAEVDGKTKEFRIRGMTGARSAKERFLKHHSMAKVLDVKEVEQGVAESQDNVDEAKIKLGNFMEKCFNKLYRYDSENSISYLDKNAPNWSHLYYRYDGDIYSMLKNESYDNLMHAAIELRNIVNKASELHKISNGRKSIFAENRKKQGVAEGSSQKQQKELAYNQGFEDYEDPEVTIPNYKSWGQYAKYYIKGWKLAQELEAGSHRNELERNPERFDDEPSDEQGVAQR